MPTLTAIGPVEVENYDLGKTLELPLVSFEKKSQIIIEHNGEYLTLAYNASENRYMGTDGKYRYHCNGPKFVATPD